MKRDEKYAPRRCTDLTCQELFGELEDIFDLRKENELTYEAMTQKINNLFEDIEMSFVVANCDFKLLFFSFPSCFAVANCDRFF